MRQRATLNLDGANRVLVFGTERDPDTDLETHLVGCNGAEVAASVACRETF